MADPLPPDDPARFRPLAAGPAFGLRNKLARIVWQLSWLLLARWTPPPLWAWRRFVLKLFGAQIGPSARIHASVRIWLPSRLTVGEGALIGPGAILYNQGAICIGAHSVISQRAHICASTHGVSDPQFRLLERSVTIDEGCWVAAEAFVGPGVTMRAGSVLSARGALFEDTAPMAVYRGNPAAWLCERRWIEEPR
ncbi:putative colanic acid biosynthesis acetyltransferase [Qipengyuania atrilutea]|uniref:Putative colanic acid biosynthesis acetyltransferase n=1 Tax=Qipengyuania atrilutea TaxID=2744473 RepID=A0A850GYH9_9SPHN|nr:putative colanic acid biosynthesis acetyltransferase [Actirhodobacter atriluteus]NVD43546.1 putative colanic acid biosynthesis acetyltransferase [Actirhodobacter atriluteus]